MGDEKKYYDEVEEGAYERSAENRSTPDPESRGLWVTGNVSTDGTGPNVEDVSPIFAQARADALSGVDEDAAARAQDEADAIRDSEGYAAPTGADAGIYDDENLKDAVPADNFNGRPDEDEKADETTNDLGNDTKVDERNGEKDAIVTNGEPDYTPDSTPEAPKNETSENQPAPKPAPRGAKAADKGDVK